MLAGDDAVCASVCVWIIVLLFITLSLWRGAATKGVQAACKQAAWNLFSGAGDDPVCAPVRVWIIVLLNCSFVIVAVICCCCSSGASQQLTVHVSSENAFDIMLE